MAQKQKMGTARFYINEALFWLHLLIFIAILFLGLLMSLTWVIVIVILWRLQLLAFHGCIITEFEQSEGGIPKSKGLIWLAAKRFFGKNISHDSVRLISILFALGSIAIAIAAQFAHLRIHL